MSEGGAEAGAGGGAEAGAEGGAEGGVGRWVVEGDGQREGMAA